MQNDDRDDQQPELMPANYGSRQPPRPPRGAVIGASSDDDGANRRKRETVRINLPSKTFTRTDNRHQ